MRKIILGILLPAFFLLPGRASAQTGTNPLQFFKNYIVTGGDYVVAGWVKAPSVVPCATANGTCATGMINLPDTVQQPFLQPGVPTTVPNGADIVGAFLYWQTVEGSQSPLAGQQGFFNNFPITGTRLGADNAPVAWSSGGCVGSSGGSKTIRTYRADVRRFLNKDLKGNPVGGNAQYVVSLPDSGSNGNTAPLALGATLVLVYRIVSPSALLSAVVIYEGSYAANNSALIMSQEIKGFYQPSFPNPNPPVAKLTHIAGSGQPNKFESVTVGNGTNTVNLTSLYGALPPFPGLYNGTWDNPTWLPNNYGNVTVQGAPSTVSTATTVITPNATQAGCPSWGAMIFSTTVQDTDHDGLLDVWETNSGLTDPNGNLLPDIHAMGANPNVQDIFTEIDYMNGVAHSHKPSQAVLDKVGDAFANKGIHVHFDIGGTYVGLPSTTNPSANPDPYIIQTGGTGILQGGEIITETACNPLSPFCMFPNFPGTVNWKTGFRFIKDGGPGDLTVNPPIPAVPGHFDHLRKDMFHYAVFAHALGLPQWRIADGTLISVGVDNSGVATVTTLVPHNFTQPPAGQLGAFVSISGAALATKLNGIWAVQSVSSSTQFTAVLQNPANVTPPIGTYNNTNSLVLSVGNGVPRTNSGVSDLGGGDMLITLGLWQNFASEFIRASTLMHELGHNLVLGHAGDISDANNCKPNYQSSMSYLFQVQGLLDQGGVPHVDYSGTALPSDTTLPPLGEDSLSLSESVGLGVSPLPYLGRWYAPWQGSIEQQLGTSAATKHCDGTPITDMTLPQMVRVDGTSLAPAFTDWNDDGVLDSVASPGQDINYNGGITPLNPVNPGLQGFNDWSHLNLQQIGSRRNIFGLSLDVGLSKDCGDSTGDCGDFGSVDASLGSVDASLGSVDASLGSVDASLGSVDESLGSVDASLGSVDASLGSVDASLGGGELNQETAAAIGNAPNSLSATPQKLSIDLNWSPPNLGTVLVYQVWRVTCPKGTTPTTCTLTLNLIPSAPLATVPPGTTTTTATTCDATLPGGPFNFCDFSSKKGVLYLYFVTADVQVGNNTKRTNRSNQVFGIR